MPQSSELFEAERPRLTRLATRLLGDPTEAQDVVQQAWLRLHGSDSDAIDNLGGWLTTVTTRLCLDRLRAHSPVLLDDLSTVEPWADPDGGDDPAEHAALADTVGLALDVVLDRLSAGERVAFVLHDSFALDFATIAQILDIAPAAARQLASRARRKVAIPITPNSRADAAVVDAFLDAARGGDLGRLLALLAPDVVVVGDAAAVALGTPERITGRDDVAAFFNGAAKAAVPVSIEDRAGAAWMHRGEIKVLFDITVKAGTVAEIRFVADPDVLTHVCRR